VYRGVYMSVDGHIWAQQSVYIYIYIGVQRCIRW